MHEHSQRLIALLRGQQIDDTPYWEPWFAMPKMLAQRYDNSYIKMAQDLGHSAIPLNGFSIFENSFFKNVETTDAGAHYGGGILREFKQLAESPMPDVGPTLEIILAQREACREAGLACWMTIRWCFDMIAASMGLEIFAMDCYDRPDFIHDAMQIVEQRNRVLLKQVLHKIKPDFLLYNGDCAYKTGTMIDPQMIRDFCFEPTKKTLADIRELDIPVIFHTDGKLDDIAPILIDLGIDAVHGCEKQANDLSYLVDQFGDQIVLCGNMDVVFLAYATPDEVRKETQEMLAIGNAKKRFIAGCNTSPQDYLPYENYEAFVRTVTSFKKRT